MPLSIEKQKAIAKLLKLDEAAFLEANKSDKEVDIAIPDGLSVFSTEELTTRDENKERVGYNKGKDAGIEQAIKERKRQDGLEFDGKDFDKFVEALKAKTLADAKVEPSKQLQEKDEIISKLQGNIQTLEQKAADAERGRKEVVLKSKITSVIPTGLTVEADEVLSSMQLKGYSFEEDESGNIIPMKNGQVVRDEKTQNALSHKAVIDSYLTERKWIPQQEPNKDGRGGKSDRKTAGITKLSEAKMEFEAQGGNANGVEFQAYVETIAKDNASFDYDS